MIELSENEWFIVMTREYVAEGKKYCQVMRAQDAGIIFMDIEVTHKDDRGGIRRKSKKN